MFLGEGREHLQELNLAVVQIEETPDDQATVDEIFRIAHSLKGMSATMGFSGMAALTHEMEDVFELLRQRSGGLERVAVDVLFECLDALSAAVESIDATGAEEIQPDRLIEMLRGLVRDRTPEQEAERVGIPLADDAELSELADGRRVIEIHATLDEDVSMAAVRAYMVLSVIAGYGETLRCAPTPDDVDTFDGRDIHAWVVSERADTEIQDAVASVPEVAEVHVFEAVPDAALDAPEELELPPAAAAAAAADLEVPADEAPTAPAAPAPKTDKQSKQAGSSTVRVDAQRLPPHHH